MKVQRIERDRKKVTGKQASTATSITSGTKNPASLGCIYYELESGEVATVFRCDRWHEGHEGIMHGGLSAAILDEAMGRANWAYDGMNGEERASIMTAEFTVKYLKPILRGEKMTAYARIERKEGRKRFASGEILNEDGVVMAKASGVYVSVEIEGDEEDREAAADPSGAEPEEL